ncbi:MAG: leucyl aminopeptidase [Planctomycetota bacterium]|nr:MAG: leucyl aminopeptidase [Planctomycetota bacterium]
MTLNYKFSVKNKNVAVAGGYDVLFCDGLKSLKNSKFSKNIKESLEVLIKNDCYEFKNGSVLLMPVIEKKSVSHYVIVGYKKDKNSEVLRRAASNLGRIFRREKRKSVKAQVAFSETISADDLEAIVEGISLPCYSFQKYKSDAKKNVNTVDVSFICNVKSNVAANAFKRSNKAVESVYFARDLINEMPAALFPESLGKIVKSKFKKPHVKVNVHNEAWLKKNKMGGILGVGQGSSKKSVLIEINYKPSKAKKHIVLVGKGVTFDSGGLSIKVGGGMVNMKMDMGGAAAVIGAMNLITELKPNVQVTALIPSVENMPDGTSYRVDDVLSMSDGSTVEVNNTDAEGRLILADALYWGSKKKPDAMIDVATLTGAIVVALGTSMAGLMSNDDDLASSLLQASAKTGEKLWRLPLEDDYRDSLKSYIADRKNTGSKGGSSITAALFLEHFVKNTIWAHLDIAGTMKAESDSNLYDGQGATGFGVRVLADYVASQA